jgi:hypothetical protein
MRTIIKNVSTLSKVLMVMVLMTSLSVNTFAQKKEKKAKKEKAAKELVRPAKVGNGDVDSFVASSFDIYEKNQKISKTLGDASGNAGDMGTVKSDLEKQMTDIKDLLGKSKAAGDAASGMPMKDKPKAVKAVKTATDALNATQAAIPGQLEMVKNQSAK